MSHSSSVSLPRAPLPLYAQIEHDLRNQILDGRFRPHDKVPSESELMQRYQVSRITVRQALSDLERADLIFKVPGKGAFVAKPKPFQQLGRLQGFAEAMAERGHAISNRLIGIERLPAAADVAARLALAEGTPITRLQRVRYLDLQPVSLDVTYVRHELGERLAQEDLAHRDIFLILENDYGIELGHADLAIDAALADATLAEQLQIADRDPVLRIERLTHDRAGTPIDFEYLYCRADNFQFRLRIDRQAEARA